MKTQQIDVPYSQKDEAKMLGAKWNIQQNFWYFVYDDKNEQEQREKFKKWKHNDKPIKFLNEDRTDNILSIDLIPNTQWHVNVRSYVSQCDWDRIRKYCYERTNYTCELCGKKCGKGELDAHEQWTFENNKQILKRILSLCKMCHGTQHYQLSTTLGKQKEIDEHLMKIRQFSQSELEDHIKQAYEVYTKRSEQKWKLDLSMIEDCVDILGEEEILQNVQKQRQQFQKKHQKPLQDPLLD